jgi:hypothetical protein
MKNSTSLLVTSVVAILIAGGTYYRVNTQKTQFDEVVRKAHKTSEGYDQKFIDMVNRLEEVLATRASFGYVGEKDPMTGQKRLIVKPKVRKKYRKIKRKKVRVKAEWVDPFRLSAIIYDDIKLVYTAIIRVGERSIAVEIGDYVEGRLIKLITKNEVIMRDSTAKYLYDIEGNRKRALLTKVAKQEARK